MGTFKKSKIDNTDLVKWNTLDIWYVITCWICFIRTLLHHNISNEDSFLSFIIFKRYCLSTIISQSPRTHNNMLHDDHRLFFRSLDVYVFHWIRCLYVFLIESLESTSKKTNRVLYFYYFWTNKIHMKSFTRSLPPLVSMIRLL